MQQVTFKVQGSSSEPYVVVFMRRSDINLSAYCSCPAGENGQYCKHRLNILNGGMDGVVSGNVDDINVVRSWLPGTDLENAMNQLHQLEGDAERVKKALAVAKKNVAKAMRD